MHKHILTFALIALVLLVQPLPLASQNSFSLSLDVNSDSGDQGVRDLDTFADQVVAIQIFGKDIKGADQISARFRYDRDQVIYKGFDGGIMYSAVPYSTSEQTTTIKFEVVPILVEIVEAPM